MVAQTAALRLKMQTVRAFKRHREQKQAKRRKANFIENFHSRGLLRKAVTGWKMYARIYGKEALRERLELKLREHETVFIRGLKNP